MDTTFTSCPSHVSPSQTTLLIFFQLFLEFIPSMVIVTYIYTYFYDYKNIEK